MTGKIKVEAVTFQPILEESFVPSFFVLKTSVAFRKGMGPLTSGKSRLVIGEILHFA